MKCYALGTDKKNDLTLRRGKNVFTNNIKLMLNNDSKMLSQLSKLIYEDRTIYQQQQQHRIPIG